MPEISLQRIAQTAVQLKIWRYEKF